MSTLGTFANFARGKKKASTQGELNLGNKVQYAEGATDLKRPAQYNVGDTDIKRSPIYKQGSTDVPKQQYPQGANSPYKSKRRVAKGKEAKKGFEKMGKLKSLKNRNLMIGAGLGLAGLGTAGAIAYNNRNSNKRSEMSFGSAFANFADTRSAEQIAAAKAKVEANVARKKKLIEPFTKTGNADADAAIKTVRDEVRKNRRKELGKVKAQKGFESAADRGNTYKNAKGGEYISRTLAAAGSPERALIAQGKKSKNGIIKALAEGAENVGKAGYKQGATGLRKAGNAIAGRTLIGKGVRLGAAGIGLSAIGGAMKRNRQERG